MAELCYNGVVPSLIIAQLLLEGWGDPSQEGGAMLSRCKGLRYLRAAGLLLAVVALSSDEALANTYTWGSGFFVPGTTAPDPMTPPDVLEINAGGTKTFSGAVWNNQSTVHWNAD